MISAKKQAYYLITSSGDSILTGVPIPAKGKKINPDSIALPRTIPIRGRPKVIPAYNNVHLAGKPNVVKIPEVLNVITPGKDGVPLPETVKASNKVVPALQPPPIRASKPQMKELAASDIRYMDVEQGLSAQSIWSMLKDSKGNLWFGTIGGGVNKYDGTYFTHYTEKEGLNAPSIWSILEDSKGNIWFGTLGGGLTKYDGNYFTHFTTEGGLNNNNIFTLLEDSKGDLWIGTNGGGLSRYDGSTFTHYTQANGLGHNDVLSLFEDTKGKLWIGTGGGVGGLSCFDGTSFTRYTTVEGLSYPDVWSIEEDREGNLWFATFGGGVNRFDGKSFAHYTHKEGLLSDQIVSLLKDTRGNLWFGSWGRGVSRFDGTNFTHYTEGEGLTSLNVLSIIEDAKGYIWFGTLGGGVNRLDEDGFHHYSNKDAFGDREVLAITEDKKGDLWFSTSIGGLSHYDGKRIRNYNKEQGLSGNRLFSIVEDLQGKFWFINSGRGIGHFDPALGESGTITFYTEKEGLTDHQIETILVDHKNNFWCGSQRKGVTHFDGKNFTHFSTKEGLSSNNVQSILEDSQGNIWFGTLGGGLSCYDGDQFINYTTNEGLIHNNIRSMLEDSQGFLWFCTMGGLSRFDGTDFTNFTTDNGLNSNNTFSIVEDRNQNLWINTDRGLTVLKPIAEGNTLKTDTKNVRYQSLTLGSAEGINKISFMPFVKSFLDQQNQIWWGCSNGLKKLDLNQFELPSEAPEDVQLTHIEVNQKFIDYRKLADINYQNDLPFGEALSHSFDSIAPFRNYPLNLSLPYNLNHLSFSFAATDWDAPHKVQYSFWIEGYDQFWSVPQSEPKAEYRNLPHGTFTLQVKAIGVGQVWSEPFAYTFTILPPWWHTWWAYTLYLLALAGGIWTFIQWRLYYLQLHYERELAFAKASAAEEANEAKSTFVSTVSHEMRTPLTSILGFAKLNRKNLIEKVIPIIPSEEQKGKKAANRIVNNLEVISLEGDRLLLLINDMLDLAKIESGMVEWKMERIDPGELVERAAAATIALFEQKSGLKLVIEVSDHLPLITADRDRLIQVLINLISNAVKFTDAGHIRIEVRAEQSAEDRAVIFSVQDSGLGIPPEYLDKIFERFKQVEASQAGKPKGTGLGLPICKEIVEHHGGKIWAKSNFGEGSTFAFTIPLSQE